MVSSIESMSDGRHMHNDLAGFVGFIKSAPLTLAETLKQIGCNQEDCSPIQDFYSSLSRDDYLAFRTVGTLDKDTLQVCSNGENVAEVAIKAFLAYHADRSQRVLLRGSYGFTEEEIDIPLSNAEPYPMCTVSVGGLIANVDLAVGITRYVKIRDGLLREACLRRLQECGVAFQSRKELYDYALSHNWQCAPQLGQMLQREGPQRSKES